ncbi:putative rRNA methylase YtqB isoform X1 [Salvia divinorum]|uniref:rRNA methylase YtqB isoform X1 n=1 Tax=Salvia divinorum TaxID=28513 RepID=A0ABD1HTT1_SALDI
MVPKFAPFSDPQNDSTAQSQTLPLHSLPLTLTLNTIINLDARRCSSFLFLPLLRSLLIAPIRPQFSLVFDLIYRIILLGLDEMMTGFIFGKKKATEVAHSVWMNVVWKGDLVVDATCGNGHDTLAMARLVADDAGRGRVIAMDLQKSALESTSSLLDRSLTSHQRGLVELYAMCHTKMEDLVPSGASVRLVAFNLGYLPGGDKKIKTESETTLLALEAAKKILARGGLISILAYVGHFGGREEFEKVRSFAAELPVDNWVCCTLQMLNRPSAPVLVLLSKK